MAKVFVNGQFHPEAFVSSYQKHWKQERDLSLLQKDDPKLCECLSSIFCLTDLFNPDNDKESYEINGQKLKSEIRKLLMISIDNS